LVNSVPDAWNASQMKQQLMIASRGGKDIPPLECPTVHQRNGESLMIEQEGGSEDRGSYKKSTSTLDGGDRSQATPTDSNATRESLTSLLDASVPFARDMPGRQSMSEKRHATLDAKSTDTYQKRKKARDDILKQKEHHQHRVTWKKSASVESLHTATGASSNFLSEEEREALKNSYVRANSVRVSRNRGTNESFRQAVDRSYDGAVAVEGEDFEIEDDDYDDAARYAMHEGGVAKKKNKNSKLLRNFGAMFRLGSGGAGSKVKADNRKSMPVAPNASSSSSMPQSQSVPDYKALYAKSRSGGDLTHSATSSDFVRPYQHQPHQQQQQQEVYEYLPTAMMRPGSRVGIADPGMSASTSDYEVIQRHLMHRTKHSYNAPPQQQQQHPHQHHQYMQSHEEVMHRRPHQQQQQQPPHSRSHSNPARARPKSNFYEYDTWSAEQFSPAPPPPPPPSQHHMKPVPPQKPSERSIQQHFSTIAATDPFLYSAASSMPPPPPPPTLGHQYQHQQQQMQMQHHQRQQQRHQQQQQYLYSAGFQDAGSNLAMVHHRPSAATAAANLPKMS
jgi:hypothetical protein